MEILSTCTKSAGSRSSGFQVIFSVLQKQLVGPDASTMTRPVIFLLSDSVISLEKVWSRGSDMAVTLVPKTIPPLFQRVLLRYQTASGTIDNITAEIIYIGNGVVVGSMESGFTDLLSYPLLFYGDSLFKAKFTYTFSAGDRVFPRLGFID